MGKYFNWAPFKLYAIDADTGKPIDPNVCMKQYVRYYESTKNGRGRITMVPRAVEASPDAAKPGEEIKRDSNSKDGQAKNIKADEDKPQADKDNAGVVDTSKIDRTTWTKEQDDTLKRMKALNNAWKDIAAALQCSPASCKKREKELNASRPQERAATPQGNQQAKQDTKKPKDNKQGQAQQKEGSKAPSQKIGNSNDMKLESDEVFSPSDIVLLQTLLAKDQRQSALRLASALFDKTGRRIHPDDIEEKIAAAKK